MGVELHNCFPLWCGNKCGFLGKYEGKVQSGISVWVGGRKLLKKSYNGVLCNGKVEVLKLVGWQTSGGTCGIGGLYQDRSLVWGGVGSGLNGYRGCSLWGDPIAVSKNGGNGWKS